MSSVQTLHASTPQLVNGTEFALVRRGTGERVVLVHGAVGDFRTWDNQLPRLAGRYEVIAYSRRGHYPAAHIPPGTAYTVAGHAEDLAGLLQALGGEPVRLVGHSYGGAVCAVVALMCPQLVRSLVLAEPSLFTLVLTQREGALAVAQSAAAVTHVAPLIRKGQTERALDEYLNVILGPGGAQKITGFSRRVMLANAHTLEPMLNGMNGSGAFTAGQAAQIRVPTLIVQGEQTPAFFRMTARTLADTIPGAELAVIPGISHGLQLEAPDEFSRVVLDFLARH
jgi:pimeloyl-ACP methyl ester carboxylesterase